MERVDVLIVGGGPAGSACARALVAAGRDGLLLDAASFPREKPCAGWITPEVLRELPFAIDGYARDYVAQPITRFRIGRIGGGAVEVDYGSPVSWGIRRSEFDTALLRASGARGAGRERGRAGERDPVCPRGQPERFQGSLPALFEGEIMSQTTEQLSSFIATKILKQPGRVIAADEKLISSGLIDSFSLMDLALFVEDTYRVRIEDTELNAETFDTLSQLSALIESHK